jgi:hypothetical protein
MMPILKSGEDALRRPAAGEAAAKGQNEQPAAALLAARAQAMGIAYGVCGGGHGKGDRCGDKGTGVVTRGQVW